MFSYALLFVGFSSSFSQSTIQSDDFRTGSLNTSLWTFINPGTPSSLNFTGVGTQDARLNFVVPAGSSHDVWSGGNFAPRIMQNCGNTDFEVEVKFESPMTAGFQIQGILVQENATKFIRFDFVRDFSGVRVFAATFTSGAPTTRFDRYITGTPTSYLRVQRVGSQWTQRYSSDGATWTNGASFSFAMVVGSVGVFAGNAGNTPPAFTSSVDYFFNTASPIIPEDPTAPPSISSQPATQTIAEGQTATFSVGASGTEPLAYQWQKNAVNISGATNSTYITPTAAIADNGSAFRCIVSNSFGTVTSNSAILNVTPLAPSISQHPTNQTVFVGQPATFSVTASGSGALSYQWQRNGADISGATGPAYTIATTVLADSGSAFRCIVSNSAGTVTSNAAILNVATLAPTISQQPTNQTVAVGQPATFSVTASGSGSLSYQWQRNGANISGATNTNYTIATTVLVDSGSAFRCIVSNSAGTVTSNAAILNVATLAPTISQQPTNQTVAVGQPATFSVTASGSGSLSYQWQKSGANISGATNTNYTIAATVLADSGSAFRCIVSSSYGTVTSNAAILNVMSIPPVISQQPINQTVTVGQPATFSITASSGVPLSYQWQRNGANISGATNTAYTLATTILSDSGSLFRCIVSSVNGTATSNAAMLIVNRLPSGVIVSDDFSSPALNTSVWTFVNPRNDASLNLSGTGTSDALLNISVPSGIAHDVWSDGNFVPRIMQTAANSDFEIEVKFQSPQTIGYQIQGVLVQQDAANFIRFDFVRFPSDLRIFAATFSGGSPTARHNQPIASASIMYLRVKRVGNLWTQSYSFNGTTWTNAANFSHTLTVSSVGVFAGNAGSPAPAHTSLVDYFFNTANPIAPEDPTGPTLPSFIAQPSNQFVLVGDSAAFSVAATGTLPLSYQWQRNNANIVSATNSRHVISTTVLADSGALFRCVVSNAAGSATSASAHLSVASGVPTISSHPQSQTITEGQAVQFSVVANAVAPVSYQWQRNSANISGATLSSYAIASAVRADSGAQFRCIVSNGYGTATSNAALLSVLSGAPIISQQPLSQTVTQGQTATFTIAATGVAPLSYQWQKNGEPISGATNASYTTPPTLLSDNGSTFRCVAINQFGATPSNAASLTVNPLPSGTILSDDFSASALNTSLWMFINPGAPSSLTMTGTGTSNALLSIAIPAGSPHDVWSNGNAAPRIMQTCNNTDFEVEVKFQSLPAAVHQLQGIIVQQDLTNYLRFDFFSDYSGLRLFAASFTNNSPNVRINAAITSGNPLWMRVKRQGNLWTQTYSFNGTTWTNGASFTHSLTVSSIGPFIGNAGGSAPAFTGLVDYFFNTAAPIVPEDAVPSPPTITSHPSPQTVAVGEQASFAVMATGTPSLSYQWKKNNGNIIGATQASYTTPPASNADNGSTFRCIVTNVWGSATSNAALLTVANSPPTITTQPVAAFAMVDESVSFNVVATGTPPLVYQWQRNGTNVPNANDALYTISSVSADDDGTMFRCVVSNATGTITSSSALLRVSRGAPLIAVQPQNQNVIAGQSAQFFVSVVGQRPFSYQWMKNGEEIPWATDSDYVTPPTAISDSGAQFHCWIKNDLDVAVSDVATLVVTGGTPMITRQPVGRVVAPGQRHRLSVEAVGPSLAYQWQKNGNNIPGAVAPIYDTPILALGDNGSSYRCRISNSAGTAVSNAALVQVVLPLDMSAPVPFRYVLIDAQNPRHPHTTTVGDIDGDGFIDITNASADAFTDGLYWYRYPTWTKTRVDTGSFPGDRQSGDIDGDGDEDLVALRGIESGVSLWWYENPRPTGDPATATWTRRLIATIPSHDVELADLNKDGKLDIIIRRDTLTIFFQQSGLTWQRVAIGSRPKDGTAIGDIDGDDDMDIAINGYWYKNPLPTNNPVTTPWSEHPIVTGWPDQVGVRVDDLNGDGRNDIMFSPSGPYSGRFSWYEATNLTTNTWIEHPIAPGVDAIHTFKSADFDFDGDVDIMTGEGHWGNQPDGIILWLNNGGGLSWYAETLATTGIHNLRIADIGNDGDIDLVGSNSHDIVNPHGSPLEMWENLSGYFPSLASIGAPSLKPTPAISSGASEKNNSMLQQLPTEYALHQNFPNPFNPTTTIRYDVPRDAHVELQLFSILGQNVATLVNGVMKAGRYTAQFDASRYASGVYFYRMQSDGFIQTRKMLVTK